MKTTTLVLLISLLMFAKKGSSVTSFNFSSFNQTTSGIKVEKDAVLSRNSLELTTNQLNTFLGNSYGRASYQYPLQLWDRRTGTRLRYALHLLHKRDKQRLYQRRRDGLLPRTFYLDYPRRLQRRRPRPLPSCTLAPQQERQPFCGGRVRHVLERRLGSELKSCGDRHQFH